MSSGYLSSSPPYEHSDTASDLVTPDPAEPSLVHGNPLNPAEAWGQPPAPSSRIDESISDLLGVASSPAPDAVTPQHLASGPYVAPQPSHQRADVSMLDPRATATRHDPTVYQPATPLCDPGADRPAIERLLIGLVVNGGSDLHLIHGEIPRMRIHGDLLPIAGEHPVTSDQIESMLSAISAPAQWATFTETGDLDLAYAMTQESGAAITTRFRVNVFRSMEHTGAVFRVIPTQIVSLDDLGIPPQIKTLAGRPRGLILVCGSTGSGKSTTQAGFIDEINETLPARIFTFEDPIEFTHTSKRALISHREIGDGNDTVSFEEGLRRVRREDPDIILIGELRDYETISAAIEAADTGHLVLATLHTNSAAETISRIINAFPSERQNQIRTTLSSVLLAVICQTLVKSHTAPRGRVVATEIMMVTPGIASNIRENDIAAISNALTDQSGGSISLDAHLVELIRSNQIKKKDALRKASSPDALERLLGTNDRGTRA